MKPLRIFVVEDEPMIAMLIADCVEEAGHEVVETASNIRDAMARAATAQFDLALLDMNLHGQIAHALPVALKARGVPFAFLTGYGQEGVLEQFSEVPILTKPFRSRTLAELLQRFAREIHGEG